VHVGGKLIGPAGLNAIAPGQLMYVQDQGTTTRFLVDSGASFSILPHVSRSNPSGPHLSGPAGQPIACWGDKVVTITLAGQAFEWRFLLAAVSFPILGIDFLEAHRFLVDPSQRRLVQAASGHVVPLEVLPSGPTASVVTPSFTAAGLVPAAPASEASVQFADPPAQPAQQDAVQAAAAASDAAGAFRALLAQFPGVVNPSKRLPPTSHGVEHHLSTAGPPISSKFRRLDAVKLAAAKEEFAQLERDGIIRRSDSPWSSPLHMVQKADGSWRPCGDYPTAA